MSTPARYDPGRDRNGHFVKGNSLSKSHSCEMQQRFKQLTAQWFDADSDKVMAKVKSGLLELVQQNDNLDVKLKACVYVADRYLGKSIERIDIQSNQPVNLDVKVMDPKDMAQLDTILGRYLGPEATPIALPSSQGTSETAR